MLDLEAIRVRQRTAMVFVEAEDDSIQSLACQGVLIGHDVPALIAEVERLRDHRDCGRHVFIGEHCNDLTA